MVRLQRDVGHEVADGDAAARVPAYGCARPGADGRRAAAAGTAARRPGRRPACGRRPGPAAARDRASRISGRGAAAESWCTAVLASTRPASWTGVPQRPAQGDRPAPVVGDRVPPDPRCPGLASARPGRRSARPAAGSTGSRSDQPMPRWSTATTRQPGGGGGQEPAPEEGPGGVAVDADHGPDGRLRAVVQHVPGAGHALPRRVRSPGATSWGRPRPGPLPGPADLTR